MRNNKVSLSRIFVLIVSSVQLLGVSGLAHVNAISPSTELVSVSESGQPGNASSGTALASDDGRYVIFSSGASNIVAGGAAGQIILRDRVENTNRVVSVNSSGELANGSVSISAISGDGRYVFFSGYQVTNISPVSTGWDIFRHDVVTGQTDLVNIDENGQPIASDSRIGSSYDGNKTTFWAPYSSPSTSGSRVYYRNIEQGYTKMVSDEFSWSPQISHDGTKIVYDISLSQPPYASVEVYDLTRDIKTRIDQRQDETVTQREMYVTAYSGNGVYAFLTSYDPNLLSQTPSGCQYSGCVYRKNIITGELRRVAISNNGQDIYYSDIFSPQVSDDGSRVVIYDRSTPTGLLTYDFNTNTTFSVGFAPDQSLPSSPALSVSALTGDGQKVLFISNASNFGFPPECPYIAPALATRNSQYVSNSLVYCNQIFISNVLEPTNTDTVPPAIGQPSWTQNPKTISQSTTLTIPVTDNLSGIAKAEYYLGDTDPGQGNGATMALSNVQNGGLSADLTTTFGTDFPTGVYKISVRAQDAAGNWSDPISDYLVVYDPAGPKMTGKRTIVPSLANGDILPGLIASGQTDKAKFAFSVKYNNQGQINANSDLQFSYSTGTKCNNPNNAQNCHTLSLNATSIAWLTAQGENNSTGIFQGVATLVIDGQTTTVQFRVKGVDGERLSPTANDRFQIQLFNLGDNPNSATPLYQVNSADIARGNIKIQ